MAIDAMWQVFELHGPTSKNDFCRLFAKSAVLVRLVNTLHNLNEAARAGLQAGAPTATTITTENSQVLNPPNKLSGIIYILVPLHSCPCRALKLNRHFLLF